MPLASAIMTALTSAASSGLALAETAVQLAVKRADEEEAPPALLLALAGKQLHAQARGHRSHRSHSSHRSHRSHYSGSSYRGGGGGSWSSSEGDTKPTPPPRPPRPKPARVSLVATPGGAITLDDKAVGRDSTGTLVLKPGTYRVTVSNRFIGKHEATISISDGQTGVVTIEW